MRRAVLLALLASLVACAPGAQSGAPYRPCGEVVCAGSINGAAYEILMPDTWNGTLILFAHGYRPAQPVPPDFAPVNTSAEPAPGWAGGDRAVGDALLNAGYALAGSAFASNGWAVEDGVTATRELYAFFKEQVGEPSRTFVWGDSLGGLVAAELAEQVEWVDGAAPMCGALAGVVPNFDLALDVTYAVRELLVPGLQLTGFQDYQQAVDALQVAGRTLIAIAESPSPEDEASLLLIAAIADAPRATRTFDGATRASRVRAAAEGVGAALVFGILGRYDLERRLGGNPSGNADTEYASRVTDAERGEIDLNSPGASERLLEKLATGQRVVAEPGPRERAAALGELTGELRQPTITLHTAEDPVVIVQNESWFGSAVQAQAASDRLLQVFTVPPAMYPEDPGAPFGAGHCNFPTRSRLAVINLLNTWTATGEPPGDQAVSEAFGAGQGLSPGFEPGPWPG